MKHSLKSIFTKGDENNSPSPTENEDFCRKKSAIISEICGKYFQMKKSILFSAFFIFLFSSQAQQNLTPEKLWELGRVSALGISKDEKSLVYSVHYYDMKENIGTVKKYTIPLGGGVPSEIENTEDVLPNKQISADGKHSIRFKEVKIKNVFAKDFYPELDKSESMIYDDLNYRHWDTWEDGRFSHIFLQTLADKKIVDSIDIMPNELFDCPQKPFGGEEDAIFSNDGKNIVYVTKKKYGKEYAISTNTDIFSYNTENKKTTNLSNGMEGYDTHPEFSSTGILAWLSMKNDGYESDKNDIIIFKDSAINITKNWDGTVSSFRWSNDGKKYFSLHQPGAPCNFLKLIIRLKQKRILQ